MIWTQRCAFEFARHFLNSADNRARAPSPTNLHGANPTSWSFCINVTKRSSWPSTRIKLSPASTWSKSTACVKIVVSMPAFASIWNKAFDIQFQCLQSTTIANHQTSGLMILNIKNKQQPVWGFGKKPHDEPGGIQRTPVTCPHWQAALPIEWSTWASSSSLIAVTPWPP